MVEVWGKVPEYGGRGRPPTPTTSPRRALATPAGAQVARKWSGDRRRGESPLRGGARSERAVGGEHELGGVHQPDLAPHERTVGPQDAGLLEGSKDAQGVVDLGGCGLQHVPCSKDVEDREPRRRTERAALGQEFASGGGGVDGAHLGDRRVAHRVANSAYQHSIGRLPGLQGSEKWLEE